MTTEILGKMDLDSSKKTSKSKYHKIAESYWVKYNYTEYENIATD